MGLNVYEYHLFKLRPYSVVDLKNIIHIVDNQYPWYTKIKKT